MFLLLFMIAAIVTGILLICNKCKSPKVYLNTFKGFTLVLRWNPVCTFPRLFYFVIFFLFLPSFQGKIYCVQKYSTLSNFLSKKHKFREGLKCLNNHPEIFHQCFLDVLRKLHGIVFWFLSYHYFLLFSDNLFSQI